VPRPTIEESAWDFSKSHDIYVGGEFENFPSPRTYIEGRTRNFPNFHSLYVRDELQNHDSNLAGSEFFRVPRSL